MTAEHAARPRVLTHEAFVESIRAAVLDALDAHVVELTGGALKLGATDADLSDLFPTIDRHARKLVARINAAEPCPVAITPEEA